MFSVPVLWFVKVVVVWLVVAVLFVAGCWQLKAVAEFLRGDR